MVGGLRIILDELRNSNLRALGRSAPGDAAAAVRLLDDVAGLDARPDAGSEPGRAAPAVRLADRHARRRAGGADLRSEEHTSELQSLMRISYAVSCLKKKKLSNKHYTKITRQ